VGTFRWHRVDLLHPRRVEVREPRDSFGDQHLARASRSRHAGGEVHGAAGQVSIALEVATGKVTDACYPRHRHEEFLKFLKQVAKTYPRVKLHLVCDKHATHNHPDVQAWLARNPGITMHFTPTSGSWLNMVEVFFGIITRQAVRRGTFTSVKDLIAAIATFIDAWNERCQPFTWTKTADEILAEATSGQRSSFTRR
jgi:transposase